MVDGFTTTYAISAYHHWCCELEFRSVAVRGVQHYVMKFVGDLWQVWFSPVSCTNKTDRHDITEILLKVVLNTIKQANNKNHLVEIDFAFPLCWNKNQVEVTLYFWPPTRIFLPFITTIVHENGNICCSVKSILYHISVGMTTLKSNWIFKIVTFWQLTISGSFYQWVFLVVIVHVLKVMLSYTLCMSLMKQFPYVYCDVIFCNFSLL